MTQNVILATIKYILVEIILDILYFPVWWYSKGLLRVLRWAAGSASFHLQRRVALRIWLRNMFKPMYGDYSRDGRIISIVFRFIILIWKLISAGLWLVVLAVLVLVWVALPAAVVYYIVYQVTDMTFIGLS